MTERRGAAWLCLLAALLFAGATLRDRYDAWIDATPLPSLTLTTSTEVVDRAGLVLRAYTVDDGRWRLAVDPAAVDPRYLAMLVAYEDKRFHRHGGVDPRATLRAAGQAVAAGRIVSGASTLTMQAARLLDEGPTGQWAGKLRQVRLALALERRLTKAQILGLYLARAPFGGNLEGLRSASRAWFGKDPARLTPAEAALLVALPQSPEARRPDLHPDAARAARDRVLDRLAAAGVLSDETARAARAEPVPTRRRDLPALAPHLADRLRAETPQEGRIATTLDAALQARVEDLARSALRGAGARVQVAIVVADHRSGEILAHVGSAAYASDRRQGFVDMSRAMRSPGSTLKPLIYALAFDAGLAHPETLIEDRPTDFGGYAPQNFDGRFRGTLRLREALQQSLNIPAVKLTQAVGPARLMAALDRAGVATALPGGRAGLAVALGGVGTTLEGLTSLYAGLAEGGRSVDLHARAGAAAVPRRRIVGPAAAWQVGDVLTGLTPPPGAPHGVLAWKTGTSYGHRDAWALGWDGRHVVGVWMGRPDGTPVPGAFGGDLAAPVLFQAFGRIGRDRAPLPAPPPDALTVGAADLPAPLRHFGREAEDAGPAPAIAFPPDGARLAVAGELAVKVRDGTPPFTWLADGAPVAIAVRDRESWIAAPGPGFVTLSVIDGTGRAARTRVRLD
ncbi:penicillin-binding protein 1C [Mesobaculum littorinae]|uniref:peptidoglycan glycosyltransferase n=1 Tax=Mesobaculum littorinae TaxID=2486419 RepID=A0A438AHS5_9RHOB|nr:penicillin-binding protein 1C [Mesobaculum littorinae]RVV98157.1 penicillin-binding protein 1C [Mesobaculum littorinae]